MRNRVFKTITASVSCGVFKTKEDAIKEANAIKGAKDTILRHKPKMIISCYHRSEDLIEIPKRVTGIRGDYEIYMRHFPSLPAWDTCFYFI